MTALNRVTARIFEAPDLRALYAIEEACFEPEVRFSRALMRSLAFDADCQTWLAMIDEVRAGFAIVGFRGDEAPNAYIWTIEVLPAFRRLGAARLLLDRVEASAVEAMCPAIELHVSERNADALALYKGHGYSQIGVAPEFYGRGENGLHYRKSLK